MSDRGGILSGDSLRSVGVDDVGRKAGGRSSMTRERCWTISKLMWGVLVLVLVMATLGVVANFKRLDQEHKEHVDDAMLLFFATADGVTHGTRNTTCFTHLLFDAKSGRGIICLNPETGIVTYRLEMHNIDYFPPVLHVGIHGPLASSTTLQDETAPVFVALDPAGQIHSEGVIVGKLINLSSNLHAIVRTPQHYYIEVRSAAGSVRSAFT